MQAMVLTAPSQLEIQDVPIPQPGPGELRIRVKSVGICGSDVHGYDGSSGRRIPPVIMGHEASGIIDAIGSNPGAGNGGVPWAEGDRVTFDSTVFQLDDWYTTRGFYNLSDGREVLGVSTPAFKRDGAFAEFVIVPVHIVTRIPEGVSFDHAAMVEPYGVAAHAVNLAEMKAAESAVVVGCGTIGLCVIQMLAAQGATTIVAIDLDAGRRELARSMGATAELDPVSGDLASQRETVNAMTHGRGADYAFEAVGAGPPVATAIGLVRRGGTVVLVGNIAPEVTIPLQKVVTEQIRLQGSCAIAGEYEQVLALMAAGKLTPDRLLSAAAPLHEGPEWFKRLHDAEPGLVKVVLHPPE